MYSGGGITLAELTFTRIVGTTLRDAFAREVAAPLGLTRTGYFQPLDEDLAANAAFGGRLGIKEEPAHGWRYYPEHAAAGLWTTPTELTKIGIALGRSVREGGLLEKKTAKRMLTPGFMGRAATEAMANDPGKMTYHFSMKPSTPGESAASSRLFFAGRKPARMISAMLAPKSISRASTYIVIRYSRGPSCGSLQTTTLPAPAATRRQ